VFPLQIPVSIDRTPPAYNFLNLLSHTEFPPSKVFGLFYELLRGKRPGTARCVAAFNESPEFIFRW
jgi:hypothetical protein